MTVVAVAAAVAVDALYESTTLAVVVVVVVVVVVLVFDTGAVHTKIRINTPKLRDNPHLPLLAQNQRES